IGLPLDHRGSVRAIAYVPHSSMVLTSSDDGTAQLWLARTQRPIGAPFSHGGAVNAVAVSRDGRTIATASADHTAQLCQTPAPGEGSLQRLGLWVRVVTRKSLDRFGAIRSLDLDTWQKDRQELDRQGGPPDLSGVRETTASQPQ